MAKLNKRKELAERALLLIQSQGDTFGKPGLRIRALLEEVMNDALAEWEANTDELVYCISKLLDANALDELQKQANAGR
jgi:hypothetical protein